MGKRSLALAGGSAPLREAAATPPEGWTDISCPWVGSLESPWLGRMALTSRRPLMLFHPSGGVAAASLSGALPQASESERFPIPGDPNSDALH